MSAFRFDWPTGVNVNHMYARNPHGGVYLTKAARDWKATVTDTVIASRQPLPPAPYALSIVAHPPPLRQRGARKRDLDGILKPLQDALFAAYDANDADVTDLRIRRGVGPAGLDVTLTTDAGDPP